MVGVSNEEIIGELRAICAESSRAVELLLEVAARLKTEPWSVPPDVIGEVRKMYPEKRTIEAFVRRARFAHAVWLDKYGPFNVEQGEYVRQVLLWVIKTSAGNRGKLHGLLGDVVNREDVDAGFKRRKGDVPTIKFDAMELLQ